HSRSRSTASATCRHVRRRCTASTPPASCKSSAIPTPTSRACAPTKSHSRFPTEHMDFALNQDQLAIREAVDKICADFGDEYWLRKDREGGFPHDFHAAMAQAGWLGVAMPDAVGGSGLGITEAAIV